jgi:hypothetical protein
MGSFYLNLETKMPHLTKPGQERHSFVFASPMSLTSEKGNSWLVIDVLYVLKSCWLVKMKNNFFLYLFHIRDNEIKN